MKFSSPQSHEPKLLSKALDNICLTSDGSLDTITVEAKKVKEPHSTQDGLTKSKEIYPELDKNFLIARRLN